MQGYIKDFRKELDSDIWMMPPLYHRIWQYLKYKVNHQENKIPMRDGTYFTIKPGQHMTSVRGIAKDVGWYEGVKWKEPNPKTVKSILDWLEKQSMIQVNNGNRQYTLITLLNWDIYQSNDEEGNSKDLKKNTKNGVKGNTSETGNNQSYQGFGEVKSVSSNSKVTDKEHLVDINKNDKECFKNDIYAVDDEGVQKIGESDGVPTTVPNGDSLTPAEDKGEISQTPMAKQAQAIAQRFLTLSKKGGFDVSPTDYQDIYSILNAKVALSDILVWMEECINNYKPKHARDKINSFSYCVPYILDRHQAKTVDPKKQKFPRSKNRQQGYKNTREAKLPKWMKQQQDKPNITNQQQPMSNNHEQLLEEYIKDL